MRPPIHHDWLDVICGFLLLATALAVQGCGGADYPPECHRSTAIFAVREEAGGSPCAGAADLLLKGDVPPGCKATVQRFDACESYTEALCPGGLIVTTSWEATPTEDKATVVVSDTDGTCMSKYSLEAQ